MTEKIIKLLLILHNSFQHNFLFYRVLKNHEENKILLPSCEDIIGKELSMVFEDLSTSWDLSFVGNTNIKIIGVPEIMISFKKLHVEIY